MKRRKALKQIGLGLSGSILLPSILDACADKDPGPEISYDGTVAIVGAGISGLYVADILHSKGIKVAIYEARTQIGGRVRSLRNQTTTDYPFNLVSASDFPVELGAQTVLGSDSIFGKIFRDYNLPVTEFPASINQFVLDNLAKYDGDWASDPDYAAAKSFVGNLRNNVGSPNTVQQSVAAAGINARAHGMINAQIGNAYGADNNIIGIGALAEEERLRTTDGKVIGLTANPLQDVLISRFSGVQDFVHLNTPITSVSHAGDPITLTAKDGTTFEANKVIVTVPVSIYKNGGITFSPGLSSAFSSSLSRIGMAGSIRVVLEFKKNFWGESVGYILGSSNFAEYFSMGVGRSKTNITLSVTVNGALADQYSAMSETALIDAILADLDALYPGSPPGAPGKGSLYIRKDINTLKNIYVKEDWTKAEHILGGYSYPMAGATNNDRKALGQPVNSKLFFAGEATDITGNAGMLNGALASAERAAEEVITAIKNGV